MTIFVKRTFLLITKGSHTCELLCIDLDHNDDDENENDDDDNIFDDDDNYDDDDDDDDDTGVSVACPGKLGCAFIHAFPSFTTE